MKRYECGVCREPNALESVRCTRCEHILRWGFLHDPSLIVPEKVEVPFGRGGSILSSIPTMSRPNVAIVAKASRLRLWFARIASAF